MNDVRPAPGLPPRPPGIGAAAVGPSVPRPLAPRPLAAPAKPPLPVGPAFAAPAKPPLPVRNAFAAPAQPALPVDNTFAAPAEPTLPVGNTFAAPAEPTLPVENTSAALAETFPTGNAAPDALDVLEDPFAMRDPYAEAPHITPGAATTSDADEFST
ncbi:MAG TPA: hypothetical protein VM694_27340, partial [Polyangium sp.]|nr:hypothetical protein [Polyangium sp.]